MCKQAISLVRLDRYKAAAELFGGDGGSAAACERVQHEIAGIRARQYDLCQQLFGLLGRMVGVLGHRPERDADVGPDIRRMRVAKVAAGRFLPVLWAAVLAVRCDDAAALFYRLEVECVVVRDRKIPDILGRVLPVRLGTAALFALPSDAVAQFEMP